MPFETKSDDNARRACLLARTHAGGRVLLLLSARSAFGEEVNEELSPTADAALGVLPPFAAGVPMGALRSDALLAAIAELLVRSPQLN